MTASYRNISMLAASFVIGCLFLSACENDINEVRALNSHGVNTEEAIDIESYLSVGGKTKARLVAPLMITQRQDTMTFPKSLRVTFYDDSTGLPSSFLYARYGVYYKNLGKVFLKDSVIATSVHGDTLTTSEMWWNQNTQDIYTDKPALLKQTNPYGINPAKGGFRAKQDFSQIVFINTNHGAMQQDSTIAF